MPVAEPLFYLAAVPAVLLAGISKGGFGGGLGILAVPLMALFVSPVQAAAIMLPILCLMDIFGLRAYRNVWDRANIAIMLPGALIGILIGTLSFRYLDEGVMRKPGFNPNAPASLSAVAMRMSRSPSMCRLATSTTPA